MMVRSSTLRTADSVPMGQKPSRRGFDRRAIKTLFRQTHIVSQRVASDIVRRLFRRHFTRGFADNQRHRCAALYGLALRIRDRFAIANYGIARLDKPDRGFRRRLVGAC